MLERRPLDDSANLARARSMRPPRDFASALRTGHPSVIAEVKPEGPKGFGLVMKAATTRLAGRADGTQVAAVARRLLGSS